MCAICLHNPCLSRCPNAAEPKPVTYCCRCKQPIEPGFEYATIDGSDYCEDCIDEMPYCELIPLLGGEWRIASVEGY